MDIDNLPEAGALLARMQQSVLSMQGDVVKFWLPTPVSLLPNQHYMIGAFIHAGVCISVIELGVFPPIFVQGRCGTVQPSFSLTRVSTVPTLVHRILTRQSRCCALAD